MAGGREEEAAAWSSSEKEALGWGGGWLSRKQVEVLWDVVCK